MKSNWQFQLFLVFSFTCCYAVTPSSGTNTPEGPHSVGRHLCEKNGDIYIPNSKVNDGVCDCCSGSDETVPLHKGGTVCANTCNDARESERREEAKKIKDEFNQFKHKYLETYRAHTTSYQRAVASDKSRLKAVNQSGIAISAELDKVLEMR